MRVGYLKKSGFKDIIGKRFGSLIVKRRVGTTKGKQRYSTWECQCDCGIIVVRSIHSLQVSEKGGHISSCGCKNFWLQKGAIHPGWKGGRWKTHEGYVMISSPDHPNAQKNGRIFEHISIMSRNLNRPLYPWESIHHKNGIKGDNRLENLELRTKNHGEGQTVDDMVSFCIEYLKLYAPEVLV